MGILKKIKTNKALKEIEPEVDEYLKSIGLLKIENGKKIYAVGSCHTAWAMKKDLLKERYNIDWKAPQEEHPEINFD